MSEYTHCPNCNSSIKTGLLSSVSIIEASAISIINEYHTDKKDAYCTKCGLPLLDKYSNQLRHEKEKIKAFFQKHIHNLPAVSTHNPLHWDYHTLGIVTGQSTTGTGVFAEFASAWTDILGRQSGVYNEKIKNGEKLCLAQLRKQTIEMGGNAIIAVDIDYSEMGGIKGMIMVCMTGTAVDLRNIEIFGEETVTKIKELKKAIERLVHLETFKVLE
jgi:uncharacterized protein YbjQ (UPF0145 family)